MRRTTMQRRPRDTGPTQATKEMLWTRAAGRCELCRRDLSTGYPFSRHHRRPRGSGGSSLPWINDVTNLLLLCGSATSPEGCHAFVERHRDLAYEGGWLIRYSSPYTPAEVPVCLSEDPTKFVFLDNEGSYSKGTP